MAITAALDRRFKVVLIQFCFHVIYQELEATKNNEFVLIIFHELYNEYVKDHNSAVEQNKQENAQESSSSGCPTNVVGRSVPSGKSMLQPFVRSVDKILPIKFDLDIYWRRLYSSVRRI